MSQHIDPTPKQTSLDALNDSIAWKSAETATAVDQEITYPSTAKELYLEVSVDNSPLYIYPFYIVPTAGCYYFNGYNSTSSDSGSCAVQITANHSVKVVSLYYKGVQKTTLSMKVKYR